MQIITQGYEITGVPGVGKIIIKPVTESIHYAEITMDMVDGDGDPTSIASFDLDGLRGFRAAIVRAEQLADRINAELGAEQE